MKSWKPFVVGGLIVTASIACAIFVKAQTDEELRSRALGEFQGDQEPAYFETDEREIGSRVQALMVESRSVEAKAILNEYLDRHPLNYRVRMDLALVLEWEGDHEAAIQELTKSLSGKKTDKPVYEMIASLRQSQANINPNQIDHGNFTEYRPSPGPTEADIQRRNELLQKSIDAYKMALVLEPNDEDNLLQIATTLEAMGKTQEADVMWQSLYLNNSTRDSIAIGYADSLLRNQKHEAAIEVLETTILSNPRSKSLYQKLSGVCNSAGNLDKAQRAQTIAEFYESLPEFCDLQYTEENAKRIARLHEDSEVQTLINDKSLESSKLLATLCWHHPHDEHEEQAFQELEKRGQDAIDLVVALTRESASTCTTRQSMRILARAKHPNAYDWLIRLLPRDTMNFGFDMDIAGSLAELNDPRAVPHLIRIFAPEEAIPSRDDRDYNWMEDLAPARARAAVALAAFDNQEAKSALQLGAKHATFAPCCNAGLYKLTKDETYLSQIKVSEVDPRIAGVLLTFLRTLQDPRSKLMADEIESKLKQAQQESNASQ